MAVRIASWNVARGLSCDKRAPDIIDGIDQLNAHVFVLSEALDKNRRFADQDFAHKLGYYAVTTEYQDMETHPSERQFLALIISRVAISHASVIRLGTRNAIKFSLKDSISNNVVHGIGAHFEDRDEEKRLGMVDSLLNEHGYRDRTNTVIAGDFNAMHGTDSRARTLHSRPVRMLARITPHARFRSLGTRLTQMADGRTMSKFEEAGYVDADPNHQPTMLMGKHGVAQLDHILHTADMIAQNFQAHHLPGSDHLAIQAEFEFK